MLINSLFHAMDANPRGRDFVVGDVHGHAALLDALLDVVKFDPAADRLIGLGDLVDRGPNSQALLERLRTQPWFSSIRGNHEAMFQGSIGDWAVERVWRRNGGKWADRMSPMDMRDLATIVDGMPLSMTLDLVDGRKIGLVHAELHVNHPWEALSGLRPDTEIDPIDDFSSTIASAALWGRTRIRSWAAATTPVVLAELPPARIFAISKALMPIAGLDQVIHGHSVLANHRPAACGNLLWIDTGSGYDDGRLTLVEPLIGRYWQSTYRGKESVVILRREGRLLPAPSTLPDSISSLQSPEGGS